MKWCENILLFLYLILIMSHLLNIEISIYWALCFGNQIVNLESLLFLVSFGEEDVWMLLEPWVESPV